jgi:cohesin domain-containing protein
LLKKRLLLWLVAGAVAALAVAWLPMPTAPQPAAGTERAAIRPEAQPAQSLALPERQPIDKATNPLFTVHSWTPPASGVQAPQAEAAVPVPPAMPYRVAGSVWQDGAMQIVLARGDAVLTVREGDTLDGGYRVEAIGPDRVTLVYVPLGVRQDLPIVSALAVDEPSQPANGAAGRSAAAGGSKAELRWDGPAQVRAGSTFRVALKVTSAEAVRAAPVQLNYDPQVVRPIAVRAGGFFSDGMFSYRVNPAGSIFVGASGKGEVPADAEFVVISFEPIRLSGTAELSVSSLSLQDAAGRAIAYEQPAAFHTTIVR